MEVALFPLVLAVAGVDIDLLLGHISITAEAFVFGIYVVVGVLLPRLSDVNLVWRISSPTTPMF